MAKATIELDSEQLNELRSLFGRTGVLPECLRMVDHRVGKLLGCDPYVMYQDILFPHRRRLIARDGTLDLNGAESELAKFGESDLNLAERVLSEWGIG